jgi:hypothetical protein
MIRGILLQSDATAVRIQPDPDRRWTISPVLIPYRETLPAGPVLKLPFDAITRLRRLEEKHNEGRRHRRARLGCDGLGV